VKVNPFKNFFKTGVPSVPNPGILGTHATASQSWILGKMAVFWEFWSFEMTSGRWERAAPGKSVVHPAEIRHFPWRKLPGARRATHQLATSCGSIRNIIPYGGVSEFEALDNAAAA